MQWSRSGSAVGFFFSFRIVWSFLIAIASFCNRYKSPSQFLLLPVSHPVSLELWELLNKVDPDRDFSRSCGRNFKSILNKLRNARCKWLVEIPTKNTWATETQIFDFICLLEWWIVCPFLNSIGTKGYIHSPLQNCKVHQNYGQKVIVGLPGDPYISRAFHYPES